jgi:hypothetical protein
VSLDLILQLALEAAEDPDALPVLGDAILEAELADVDLAERVFSVVTRARERGAVWVMVKERDNAAEYFRQNASTPTPTFAKALAAVLLCRDWQTKPWRYSPDAFEGRLSGEIEIPLLDPPPWAVG